MTGLACCVGLLCISNSVICSLQPNQYTLVNGAQQQQTAPSVPAFRIAPVNSLLINAAAKRARDPRLQKVSSEPPPKKLPVTSEAVTAPRSGSYI